MQAKLWATNGIVVNKQGQGPPTRTLPSHGAWRHGKFMLELVILVQLFRWWPSKTAPCCKRNRCKPKGSLPGTQAHIAACRVMKKELPTEIQSQPCNVRPSSNSSLTAKADVRSRCPRPAQEIRNSNLKGTVQTSQKSKF